MKLTKDIHAGTTAVLADIGTRIKFERLSKNLSRAALSELSKVSPRYLAQLESGAGNISIGLLYRVACALELSLEALFAKAAPEQDNKPRRIALIGLRGAGKSTLGPLLAEKLGSDFVELNDMVQHNSGMPVAEVFALYGQDGYRDLEKQALISLTNGDADLVLAVGGGIVSEPETYSYLRAHFQTIWLRANAEDHMDRVRAQGDVRPMAGRQDAMASLRAILREREAQYAKADWHVNTSNVTIENSLKTLLQQIDMDQ